MKYHFKRTFDCLKLSDESQERICTMLTAHMKDSANMPSRPKGIQNVCGSFWLPLRHCWLSH